MPQRLDDPLHHVAVVEAGEQGKADEAGACVPCHRRLMYVHLPSNELREDASCGPHVHRAGVVLAAHEELRGAIRPRDDVVGEENVIVFHPLSVRTRHGLSRYAEVADLEVPQAVEEEVGGFDIAVNDFTVLKVG
eukprot:754313-Hanusia_phi.AAC.4